MASLQERCRRSRSAESRHAEFPQKLDWTIAFHVGVELIPLGCKVIAIGHPSAGFERWDSDKPVHRPVALVTRPDTGDPDQWKPAKLDGAWRAAGIASFRAEVKAEASDLRFRDKDVNLVKAYRAKSGRVLFALELSKFQGRSGKHTGSPATRRKP